MDNIVRSIAIEPGNADAVRKKLVGTAERIQARVAVVTGGARGIGLQIARQLAAAAVKTVVEHFGRIDLVVNSASASGACPGAG